MPAALGECFPNYGQTPPAVGRKRFAPAPGKTSLFLYRTLESYSRKDGRVLEVVHPPAA
jgi:hypothetical protein